jgi:IS605 OrfB family transposase
VANRLVAPATLLGLEDLTHIRERTKRAGKRQRRKYAKWAFAEVGAFIAYKAALAGSVVVKVDADYTSQQCPTCGYRAKKNRPRNGLRFRCTNPEGCRCELHADLVGARQVCLRTLAVRQDWPRRGICHLPLMCRPMKPKPRACNGTRSCGGGQTQAPGFSRGAA